MSISTDASVVLRIDTLYSIELNRIEVPTGWKRHVWNDRDYYHDDRGENLLVYLIGLETGPCRHDNLYEP